MKLNSNTIILDETDRKALEDIIVKVASSNEIENVESISIHLSSTDGSVKFKTSTDVYEFISNKNLGKGMPDLSDAAKKEEDEKKEDFEKEEEKEWKDIDKKDKEEREKLWNK